MAKFGQKWEPPTVVSSPFWSHKLPLHVGGKRAQQGCCFTTPPPPIECVDTHTEVSFLYAWCPPGLVTSQALFECRLVAVGYYPAQTADMACVSDLPSFHWSLLFWAGGLCMLCGVRDQHRVRLLRRWHRALNV